MDNKIYENKIEGTFIKMDDEIKVSTFGPYREFYINIFGEEIKLLIDEKDFIKYGEYLVKGIKVPVYKIKKGVGKDKEYFRFDKYKFIKEHCKL